MLNLCRNVLKDVLHRNVLTKECAESDEFGIFGIAEIISEKRWLIVRIVLTRAEILFIQHTHYLELNFQHIQRIPYIISALLANFLQICPLKPAHVSNRGWFLQRKLPVWKMTLHTPNLDSFKLSSHPTICWEQFVSH